MEDKLKAAPLAYENESFLNSPDGRFLRILAEYSEPLTRFRREQIQDTVVFFGSARFHSHASAQKDLSKIQSDGAKLAKVKRDLQNKKALAAVNMARYYEDARKLANMFTKWAMDIPPRRRRFVVTTGGGGSWKLQILARMKLEARP